MSAPSIIPPTLLRNLLSFPVLTLATDPSPSQPSLKATLSSSLSKERALTDWLLSKKAEYMSVKSSLSASASRKRKRLSSPTSQRTAVDAPALRRRVKALKSKLRSATLSSVESLTIVTALSTVPPQCDVAREADVMRAQREVEKARLERETRWKERRERAEAVYGARAGAETSAKGQGGEKEGGEGDNGGYDNNLLRSVLLEAVLAEDRWWMDEKYCSLVLKLGPRNMPV